MPLPNRAVIAAAAAQSVAAQETSPLDKALESLKKYDYGSSRALLIPIDEAVQKAVADSTAKAKLEQRLVGVLPEAKSLIAREYICGKLTLIGTAAAVPGLSPLLADAETAQAARNALERIPGREANAALVDALGKTSSKQKAGVLDSLGARRDPASVSSILPLLAEADPMVASSAAAALGAISGEEAASALKKALEKAADSRRLVLCDAALVCAEGLLKAGKKSQALDLYKSLLAGAGNAKHVQLAAKRGLLEAARK